MRDARRLTLPLASPARLRYHPALCGPGSLRRGIDVQVVCHERVREELQAERLKGMRMFAADLAARGHLREGVTTNEARDVLWTYNSAELYRLLVIGRGWSAPRYGHWVSQALTAALKNARVKIAIVVPNTAIAYLARLAFADANHRIFYSDLSAAALWLRKP